MTEETKAETKVESKNPSLDFFNKHTKNFSKRLIIDGESAEYWLKYFTINIGDINSMGQVRNLFIKLDELLSQSAIHSTMAGVKNSYLQSSANMEYRKNVNSIYSVSMEKKEKLPSQDIRDTISSDNEIQDAFEQSKIIKGFWNDITESLNTKRKILETISMTIAVETKTYGSVAPYQNEGR